jgi:probable phosphoglycerate mutase
VTRLLLWRHAQTSWNASSRIQGQRDVALDAGGRAAARESALRLAEQKPTRIVSSDLSRAAQTAAELAAVTGLAVQYDVRLRERAYGEWQGLTPAEIERRWPTAYGRWVLGEPVDECGVEGLDSVGSRMLAVLHSLLDGDATVVVATHGGAARRAIGAVLDWPVGAVRSLAGLANCHWSELRHRPDRGWQLWSHNVF